VAKKLLNGSFPPRFPSALELVIAGYDINCDGYEDRANLAAALRGEPDPGAAPGGGSGGPGSDPGEDEGEDEDGGGIPTSTTLTGSGTVAAEGSAYRYTMTFNEPITGYLVQVGGTSIACPSAYGDCASHNTTSAGGVTLNCGDSPDNYTFEFACFSRREASARDRTPPPAVPANTQISGTFTINAGSVQPGKTKVIAYGSSGQSQPITLSGP
jgi:hypothetical protein